MTNQYIDEFLERKNIKDLALTKDNCIRISENIIDINPVPIYIKIINDYEKINNEINIIAADIPVDELYLHKQQDPNKLSGIFTSQNAYVPSKNILTVDNMYIDLLKKYIFEGISEMIKTLYNYRGDYSYKIESSWIQKYKNGSFLSPHNHLGPTSNYNNKTFSIGYYINDGDPDMNQTFSGCISFISNNNLFHIRPKNGTLLIWDNSLIHLVNPFYSNSEQERFMLSANISIEF